MDRDQIKQLAADVLNKKVDLKDIPRGRTYLTLQNIFQKMGNLPLVKEMATLSGQRLAAKGYRKCGDFGWVKNSELPNMGIGQVYGKWVILDVDKNRRYKL